VAPEQAERLRALAANSFVTPSAHSIGRKERERAIPAAVADALSCSLTPGPQAGSNDRRASGQAREFIHADYMTATRLEDLCRLNGAPERSLQRALRSAVDLGRDAYLRTVRFAHVRRLLRNRAAGSVTGAAIAVGFGL